MEVPVETQDVWVSEVLLDFDFAADLFFDFGVDDFGFVEAFEGEDVSWLGWFGAYHVDAAEFAFAERAADVEGVEAPFAGGVFAGCVVWCQ